MEKKIEINVEEFIKIISEEMEGYKCTGEYDDIYSQSPDGSEYYKGLEICAKTLR